MQYFVTFLVTGVVFAVIDAIWLKLTANFYKKEFGSMLRAAPNFFAAAAFYLIYVLGIVFFVLQPSWEVGEWWQVAVRGAAFGMIAYAAYDLTNLATLKNWSLKVVIIDILWGMAATGGAAMLSFLILEGLF